MRPSDRDLAGHGGASLLQGRTALVTGGAVRVGRAISLALGRAGVRVVVHYHASEDEAAHTAADIIDADGEAAIVRADLASIDEVRDLVGEAESRFGPIDILINNASVFPSEDFGQVTPELWEHTLAVNLRAPFFLTQQIGGRMKAAGGGVVINIADLAGIETWKGYAAHSIAKAGLIHMTRVAARALAPEVRVAAIAPGAVLPPESLGADEIQALADRTPLRRIGSAEDVAGAVLYLVGADFVTGEVLVVDGGRLLR